MDLDRLEKIRELMTKMTPSQRREFLKLCGILVPRRKRVKIISKHGNVVLPNKIITEATCLHCGSKRSHSYSPRIAARIVKAGSVNREKDVYENGNNIEIRQETKTRSCSKCWDFIQEMNREELENRYYNLLRNPFSFFVEKEITCEQKE